MLDGERQIVEQAIGGDASAFGLLYDHYVPSIYRFVFLKVSRREEAEDITHQVFLHAWQHIGTYQHLGYPFSSWLYRIARNKVIDYYRTRKLHVSIENTNPDTFVSSPDRIAEVDTSFTIERVMHAVAQLKPEHQDVIILRFVEELSTKETATALEKTEGAIKLIQHRALAQLRKLLTMTHHDDDMRHTSSTS